MSNRLFELFRSVTWEEVEAVLRQAYPDYAQFEEIHRGIFDKMCALEPKPDDLWVMLSERVEVWGEPPEENRYLDVDSTDRTPNPHKPGEMTCIGLDFRPWAECLGMRILEETRAAYSEVDIVAHSLMEMIFYGLDEETVKESRGELLEAEDDDEDRESMPAEDMWCHLGMPPTDEDGATPAYLEESSEGAAVVNRVRCPLVAVYSDVHGDLEALRAAFALAEERGCTMHLCCGDLVDEAWPADEILAFRYDNGIQCVRGNHERWLLAAVREERYGFPLTQGAFWFLEEVSVSDSRRWGPTRVAVHHARPGSDMDGLYEGDLSMADVRGLLAEAECDVLLVGHTHEARVARHPGGGLVANPGALGRPPFVPVSYAVPILGADEASHAPAATTPRAGGTFGILDPAERTFVVLDLQGNRVLGDSSE